MIASLLAQTAVTPEVVAENVRYSWDGMAEMAAWPGLAITAALLAVVLVPTLFYITRREQAALPLKRWAPLLLLRLIAIVALAGMLGGLARRQGVENVRRSRVVVLADSSLSMALPASHNESQSGGLTRGEELEQLWNSSPLFSQLSTQHDVDFFRCGEELSPLSVGKGAEGANVAEAATAKPSSSPKFELTPGDAETKLGDALGAVLQRYADAPLAGIILCSDGRNNGGAAPLASAALAKEREVVTHTIGFGPTDAPPNLMVRDLQAPARAYAGDDITLSAMVLAPVSSNSAAGATRVECRWYRRPLAGSVGDETLLGQETLRFTAEESLLPVRINDRPPGPGQYLYRVEVSGLANEQLRSDNVQAAKVLVVEQVVRTLLAASGPSRDFHFLRNQLRRDKTFAVDVLLQSATEISTAEDSKERTDFPPDEEALDRYDAIVAFDLDWAQLPAPTQAALIRWVADEAGGLIIAPGPVQMPRILQKRSFGELARLSPVDFADNLLLVAGPPRNRPKPRPVQLTRAGESAEFLWLAGSAAESRKAWENFTGLYGAFPATTPKPGATVYATLAPAADSTDARAEVLFAEQFYGGGRTFFIGSSECWRLRGASPDLFTGLFTKLLRHVSQGRLVRGAGGAQLVFERERYEMGEMITLRATLRRRAGESIPAALVAQLSAGGGQATPVELKPNAAQRGAYEAKFPAATVGPLQAELGLGTGEPLAAESQVVFPVLESRDTLRDAKLLAALASAAGGNYYATPALALSGGPQLPALAEAIPSREERQLTFGSPDAQFARNWSLGTLLTAGCALISSWLLRRLWSLA